MPVALGPAMMALSKPAAAKATTMGMSTLMHVLPAAMQTVAAAQARPAVRPATTYFPSSAAAAQIAAAARAPASGSAGGVAPRLPIFRGVIPARSIATPNFSAFLIGDMTAKSNSQTNPLAITIRPDIVGALRSPPKTTSLVECPANMSRTADGVCVDLSEAQLPPGMTGGGSGAGGSSSSDPGSAQTGGMSTTMMAALVVGVVVVGGYLLTRGG